MTQTTKPSNQEVRSWMQKRQADRTPLPSLDQIRMELGWKLVEAEREAKRTQHIGKAAQLAQ